MHISCECLGVMTENSLRQIAKQVVCDKTLIGKSLGLTDHEMVKIRMTARGSQLSAAIAMLKVGLE